MPDPVSAAVGGLIVGVGLTGAVIVKSQERQEKRDGKKQS
jgi:hypothetical protein